MKFSLLAIAAFSMVSTFSVAGHHEGGHDGMKKDVMKGHHFEKMDMDQNGEVSMDEFMNKYENKFSKIDKDGNGSISQEEYKNHKMMDKPKDMMHKGEEMLNEGKDAMHKGKEDAMNKMKDM